MNLAPDLVLVKQTKKVGLDEIIHGNLRYSNKNQSIKDLIKNAGKIDHKPYFQRNYVWDLMKASFYLETGLLGNEMTPIILFQKQNRFEIIDGRQRFETILRFADRKFKLHGKGLSYLKHLAGLNIDTLPVEFIERFWKIEIRTCIYELHANVPYYV